jgi:hypothetical protein
MYQRDRLWNWEVDGTSGLCLMTSFDISSTDNQ